VFAADYVGNLIGWGRHLGLVEEASEGERAWRLLDPLPVYEIMGGRCVRVRGLPDGEQAAMNRKVIALRRRRATLARKKAEETRRKVGGLLDRLSVADWRAVVPAGWLVYLGEHPAALQVREARDYILAAHDEWEPAIVRRWIEEVEATVTTAERSAVTRRAEAAAAAAAARLAEDAEAFEGL
ncbi:MAG TPA: hypothetical protein VK951_01425, partial [Miltoncostaeaceae bacterium]|nr:hypothetical protein [Miltoncostaeaceae bacterium]